MHTDIIRRIARGFFTASRSSQISEIANDEQDERMRRNTKYGARHLPDVDLAEDSVQFTDPLLQNACTIWPEELIKLHTIAQSKKN